MHNNKTHIRVRTEYSQCFAMSWHGSTMPRTRNS